VGVCHLRSLGFVPWTIFDVLWNSGGPHDDEPYSIDLCLYLGRGALKVQGTVVEMFR